MKSYRTEVERLTPHLRQFARALVDSFRIDTADEIVHDTLAHAMRCEQLWSADDLQARLYARLISANRLRLQSEVNERRTLPGRSSSGEGHQARRAFSSGDEAGHGLESLPLGDREALLLVVLARLDYHQAAEILGMPTTTLVTLLSHARDHLGTSMWSGPSMRRTATASLSPKTGQAPHLRLVKS